MSRKKSFKKEEKEYEPPDGTYISYNPIRNRGIVYDGRKAKKVRTSKERKK
jgi:hypothetical protein